VKIATENMVHLHTYKKSLNLKFILRHNLFMFSPKQCPEEILIKTGNCPEDFKV
jgi:hypothetical protein